MSSQAKFDLVPKSIILRGEKANKGLEAIAAPNPNQMNRLIGYLDDGTKVVVAQRPGRGGMDFNKLLGGKVFAVAADGVSPVFEKDKDNKPTKVQKTEDGLPLYSSSGFYLLSSKEYPAVMMLAPYTMLINKGDQVLLLTQAQMDARQKTTLASDFDLELLPPVLEELLLDGRNLVTQFDEDINKKRKRGIERGKEEAEDAGEEYAGAQFEPLTVSKKDGNPFILYAYSIADGPLKSGLILREVEEQGDTRPITRYLSPAEAIELFTASADYKAMEKAVAAGQEVSFAYVQGHVMRTSVSFRRKVENIRSGASNPAYGDGVYITAALNGWTKGLISVMYSQHPNFPQVDYDSLHYVAACRQAEIGMNKKPEGGWTPPVGIAYDLPAQLLA